MNEVDDEQLFGEWLEEYEDLSHLSKTVHTPNHSTVVDYGAQSLYDWSARVYSIAASVTGSLHHHDLDLQSSTTIVQSCVRSALDRGTFSRMHFQSLLQNTQSLTRRVNQLQIQVNHLQQENEEHKEIVAQLRQDVNRLTVLKRQKSNVNMLELRMMNIQSGDHLDDQQQTAEYITYSSNRSLGWIIVFLIGLMGPLGAFLACKYVVNNRQRALAQAFWTIIPIINLVVWLDLILVARKLSSIEQGENKHHMEVGHEIPLVKLLPFMNS